MVKKLFGLFGRPGPSGMEALTQKQGEIERALIAIHGKEKTEALLMAVRLAAREIHTELTYPPVQPLELQREGETAYSNIHTATEVRELIATQVAALVDEYLHAHTGNAEGPYDRHDHIGEVAHA